MKSWRVSVLVGIGMVAIHSAVAAPISSAAPMQDSAVADFGACMAAQGQGDVLLMIDESASLQVADPGAARVTAANHLLNQLSSYSENSGAAVNVAVAGFAEDYVLHADWATLDTGSLAGMESTVEGFRGRQNGRDTDYKLALDGALETMATSGANNTGDTSCQAIAWLTDGNLDFTARDATKSYAPDVAINSDAGVARLISAANESICRDGGVADQLRSSGIVTFAIGLTNSTASPEDFNLMRAIATGEVAGENDCGKIKSPSPGAFFLAQDIDDLLFAFDAFSTPGQAPIEQTSGVCQGEVCAEGEHRFVLDNSIGAVDVLATADATGLVPTVVSPSGQQVALDNRDTTSTNTLDVGGVALEYKWQSEKSVSFSLSNGSAPGWQGVWALVFVDPTGASATATSRSSIHISGNLFPALAGDADQTLHSGDEAKLQLGIVDLAKQPVDPAKLLGQATMSATLLGPGGAEQAVGPIDKGALAQPVALDLGDVAPGNAKLRLTLNVTTAAAPLPDGGVEPGTALVPQSVDIPVTIAPPLGYPVVPSMIDFGTVEGAGSFTASPMISGAGCVWLDAATPARVAGAPDGIGAVTVASKDAMSKETCVSISDGTPVALPLAIEVPNAANGVVNGTVSLSIAPVNATGDVLTVDVPFTAQAQKPLDSGKFWLTLILMLVLGPGIPLLLLYLSKWLTAKIPAQPLKVQSFEVQLANHTVLRDGQPFALADRDLVELVRGLEKPARRLSVDGVELSTKTGRSPFGAGYVVAHVPGKVGASGQAIATDPKTNDARLPLAVHNTWFVAHDPAGPENEATLVLLVGATASPAQVQRLVEQACQMLPETLPRLRADVASRAGASSGSGGQAGQGSGSSAPGSDPFAPASGRAQPPAGNPFAPLEGGPIAPPAGNPFGQQGGPQQAPPQQGGSPFEPPASPNPFDPNNSW